MLFSVMFSIYISFAIEAFVSVRDALHFCISAGKKMLKSF